MKKIRTAVIGTGYLGKYHVEKFATLPRSELIAICDINLQHTHALSEKYHVSATDDYRSLLGKVDAVSIVSSTPTHFEIGHFFLTHGVHVFIEKPITTTPDQSEKLIAIAKKNKLTLQVGHVERFNTAFRFAKPHIINPRFIEAQRVTSFQLRGSDVSVILDLMIHDIDLVLSTIQSPITDIRATDASVLTSFIDIANARIEFESGCAASITASRIHSNSERKLRIFQDDRYINIDLQRNACRTHKKGKIEIFPGIPNLESEERQFNKGDALQEEIADFLQAIATKTKPLVSGEDAHQALTVATTITELVMSKNKQYV